MSTGVLSINCWQVVFCHLKSFGDMRMLAQTCRRIRELFLMLQKMRFNELGPMFFDATETDFGTIDFSLMVQSCGVALELKLDKPTQSTILYREGIHTVDEFCKRLNITSINLKGFKSDIELVTSHSNASADDVLVALCRNNGDIVNSIMAFKPLFFDSLPLYECHKVPSSSTRLP